MVPELIPTLGTQLRNTKSQLCKGALQQLSLMQPAFCRVCSPKLDTQDPYSLHWRITYPEMGLRSEKRKLLDVIAGNSDNCEERQGQFSKVI